MRQYLGALAVAAVVGLAACSDTTEPAFQAEGAGQGDLGINEEVLALGKAGWAVTGATVFVGHGINGTDLGAAEALPVDVSVNGACALPGFEFRAFAGPLELDAGDYEIAVSLANTDEPCSNDPVIGPVTVTVNDGDNATIFAHLTDGGTPTASVFPNAFARPGRAQFAARHAANFGPVDVIVDPRSPKGITVPDLANGNQVSTPIRPGRHSVALAPAGSMTPVFEISPVLRPFTSYYAYAVGTPSNGTFEVLLQTVSFGR